MHELLLGQPEGLAAHLYSKRLMLGQGLSQRTRQHLGLGLVPPPNVPRWDLVLPSLLQLMAVRSCSSRSGVIHLRHDAQDRSQAMKRQATEGICDPQLDALLSQTSHCNMTIPGANQEAKWTPASTSVKQFQAFHKKCSHQARAVV